MHELLPLLLLLFGCRSSGAASPPERAPRTQLPPETQYPLPPDVDPISHTTAPPWPQAVPAGLPQFPGPGWEFDEPPPAVVQQRAGQLRASLWAGGQGTSKVEQTAGRWIAYRAEVVKSGKQGVVAYRLKTVKPKPAAPTVLPKGEKARSPAPSTPRSSTPATPASTLPPAVAVQTPVSVPAPRSIASLPDLKYGDGLKPKAPVPEVAIVQERLKLALRDGRFGNETRDAVIKFQVATGLAPNLPIEQLRARGYGAVKKATWAKLFEVRA